MENKVNTGAVPSAYDYRLYDHIWKRVSPELDPYPEVRAASAGQPGTSQTVQTTQAAQAAAPAPAVPPSGGNLENLPGAEENPCCMGTQAQESVGVLEGFIEEEASDRRYLLLLARHIRSQQAATLLRSFANEKQEAVGRLRAAYFLITGRTYTPAVVVEQLRCRPLPELLREVYHQEACGGFNYDRAADETTDPCLTKLFGELSKGAYKRSEQILNLLGTVIR